MRIPCVAVAALAAALASPCTRALAQAAPSATAPTPAAPPKADPPEAPARPFGPGTAVDVQADKPYVYVFVAKGAVDPGAVFPDPFVKVGRAPVRLELPPGVYTILAEGEEVPAAHVVFAVEQRPVHVSVDAGSQGLRGTGTLLSGLGLVAALAGIVLEVSRTQDEDSSDKRKISIPLMIGGGVLLAGGLTAFFVSTSSIEHDGFVPTPQHEAAPTGFRGIAISGTF